MGWKRVVEVALRDYGFGADAAELAIGKLIEEATVVAEEQPPPKVVGRCIEISDGRRCKRDAGHIGMHFGIGGTWPQDSSVKPETTTCYVVEQRHGSGEAWVQLDSPNYTIRDAQDERDAAADTIDRDRLRIVRVTETREVVE